MVSEDAVQLRLSCLGLVALTAGVPGTDGAVVSVPPLPLWVVASSSFRPGTCAAVGD